MPAAIRLSHYALNAPTGAHPAGVYWACQAGIPAYQADRNLCIPDPNSGNPDPVMLGRIPSEHDEAPFNPQRLIPHHTHPSAPRDGEPIPRDEDVSTSQKA